MQMLLARSAITRGMQLVAGMLSVVVMQDALSERYTASESAPSESTAAEIRLVSWTSNASSRREDELARSRQQKAES